MTNLRGPTGGRKKSLKLKQPSCTWRSRAAPEREFCGAETGGRGSGIKEKGRNRERGRYAIERLGRTGTDVTLRQSGVTKENPRTNTMPCHADFSNQEEKLKG